MEKEVLKPTFMVIAIIGFIISAIYSISGRFTEWFDSWGGKGFGLSIGFAFCLVFIIMFIASIVTMNADVKPPIR